jgi:uncharacterized delta-60 repeat protein
MKRAFGLFAVCVLWIGLSGFGTGAAGAPGDLDFSFSSDGKIYDILTGVSTDRGEAAALQADGKIVVAGNITYGNNRLACGIARYNTDGSLDMTFDGDGKVYGQIGLSFSCRDIAVQADGKIVIAGSTQPSGNSDFAVMRFNPNGSFDATFDGDGIVTTHIEGYDSANALAIQADGKIVAAGTSNTGGANFSLVRYNPNGSLDTAFSDDGKISTDFGGTNEVVSKLAIQADGKIVAAGYQLDVGNYSFALARYNADGSLDNAFDGDGIVLTAFESSGTYTYGQANAIAIQADGKIIAAGAANSRFALTRYNADGSLDTTFDTDGKVVTTTMNSSGSSCGAYAIALQTDGRIVATGYSANFGTWNDFTVVRYNTDGSLDSLFDGDGIASTDFGATNETARATVIQTDGKIVAAGYKGEGTGHDYALIRYNADGSLDASFDFDGKTITDMGFPTPAGTGDVAVQADGKILVAGYSYNGFNDDFTLVRYNVNGTRDDSFGGGSGKVVTDISGYAQGERAKSLAIQADGKIVVAGETTLSVTGSDYALVRYNADGSRDFSFDGDGVVTTDFGSSFDFAYAVAIQPDGKIVAAGYSAVNGNNDFALVRYNANGSLDTTFDEDGKVTTSFTGSNEYAYAVTIQADGKIVAAGSHTGSTFDFALARYNANGSLDTSFDGDGKATTDIQGSNDGAQSVAIQTDGKIVAAGGVSNGSSLNFDYALVRYNADGSPDTSFDGDGKVSTNVLGNDTAIAAAIQTDGRIVVAGYSYPGSNNNEASLARYNTNGSLDATFGTGGVKTFDMNGATNDFIYGMALDPNGKIVVAGDTNNSITVARILTDFTRADAPFDFDGDGKSDLSIFRPTGGEWWYLRSSDGGSRAFGFGNSSDKLVPADYTGDGKTDIAVWRPSTGEWFVLRSEEVSYYSFPFGTAGDVPVPADFDADGKADAAVFRPSSLTWYIRRSSDGITITQQFGQAGDVPVAADYDGDGRSDIAVWRASAGQWWINRSTAGIVAYTFGSSSDKPVQGDYTGDGKADVAFFRPSTSEWFVLRSENQSYYSFAFGASGDTPAPADYDGDGKTDATIFRPSANTWYSQRTTAGILIQSFGQTGDVPVPNVFVP